MPAVISTELQDHLALDTNTLAACCLITRRDGAILGFTNHQHDIVLSGVRYRAGSGMTPSALQTKSGIQVDNAEMQWLLQDDQVSDRDVRGGLYDEADVRFFLVNYEDLSQGILKGPAGTTGRVRVKEDGTAVIEFRSLAQKATNEIGELTSFTCRAHRLGDTRCKFDLDGETEDGYATRAEGWVTDVDSSRQFTSNLNNTDPPPYTQATLYTWDTAEFDRDLGEKPLETYDTPPIDTFNGDRVRLVSNENIEKKLVVGDTGTLHAIRIADAVPVDFPFVAISVRQEADDSWSFQVDSSFWDSEPDDPALGFPDEFFRNGILRWRTGANAGIECEVMSHAAGVFVLQEMMPFPVTVDDTFTVEVGCDRTIEMCAARFGNAINFQGEPYIKPVEQVMEIDDIDQEPSLKEIYEDL